MSENIIKEILLLKNAISQNLIGIFLIIPLFALESPLYPFSEWEVATFTGSFYSLGKWGQK